MGFGGQKGRLAAAGLIAIGLGVAGTTGAVAGVMVTSADIKDGTIKARDMGENSVGWRGELKASTRGKIASLAGQDGQNGADGAAGAAGADGAPGAAGASYDIWLTQPENAQNDADGDGTPGTSDDFLASLVGPQGAPGPAGADGQAGADGSSVTSFTFSYKNVNYTCTDGDGDGNFACADDTPPAQ